jgi:hypothetical protein
MTRTADRLRRLEQRQANDNGPRYCISAVPIPEEHDEADSAIEHLLAIGQAKVQGYVLAPVRDLTLDEWVEEFAPALPA